MDWQRPFHPARRSGESPSICRRPCRCSSGTRSPQSFQGIDGKARTFPIEAAVAVPEGVDVAAIFVAKTVIALILIIVTTLNAFTHVLPWSRNVAWVRGVGSCHVVGLPNIHLGTAGTIVTKAHAFSEILGMRLPILRVGDAIELDVIGATGISTKYMAPSMPHSTVEKSTSTANLGGQC